MQIALTPEIVSLFRWSFVNINRGFVGGRETGVNDGTFVRWIDGATDQAPPAPWCASQQAKCGTMLLYHFWPVPTSAECKQLGDWAERRGCLHAEPAFGALGLVWHEKDSRGPRFAHVYAVEQPKKDPDGKIGTLEGNTSEKAGLSNEGTGSFRKLRPVAPKDRFVYWWEVLPPTLDLDGV